jgi:Lysozyme like domain/LysM domain
VIPAVPPLVTSEIPAVHVVIPGDTLWGISAEEYGSHSGWPAICQANRELIRDCNLIYPGQRLVIPVHTGASLTGAYRGVPKKKTTYEVVMPRYQVSGGTLSCSGLEALWDDNGGNPAAAFMAAEIAMAESGGQQYAVSPTQDYGYWQINMSAWGPSLATFSPDGNARAAIEISHDGTNWEPWTTYQTGAYIGRC